MDTFHNFDFKIKTVKQQGLFSPFWKLEMSMMGVCIYVCSNFPGIKYFEPQKVAIFEVQLCPIDQNICRRS